MTACRCGYPVHALECDCAPRAPERVAADRIAAILTDEGLLPPLAAALVAVTAVEAIAAAGLVIVPAGRVAAWMGGDDA